MLVGARPARLVALRGGATPSPTHSCPTARPARPIRCCSTSRPAPPRSPSWSSTPIRATRWGTCPRCTGSGSARATSTGTSARPAGPSTRGAARSRRGMRARRCSAITTPRFEPRRALDTIVRCGVTTLCAPPTVWRMLVGEDLGAWPVALREVVGAGEPLNPEVIERVRRAWGLTIRDGYGQTETTAQVGNPPGQPVKPGSMGRPLPGYRIVLLNEAGVEADEGEIVLPARPAAARPHGRLPGRRVPLGRRAPGGRLSHRRRRRSATPTATSPTSAAPTTSSRARTIGSARSSSRARWWSTRTSPRRRWCRARIRVRLSVPKAFVVLRGDVVASREVALVAVPVPARPAAALQADSVHRVRRAAEDDLGQDPPGGPARARGRPAEGRHPGGARVLGGGFSGAPRRG